MPIKKEELNSSPFSNVNPQTHNVRSISDVKYCKVNTFFYYSAKVLNNILNFIIHLTISGMQKPWCAPSALHPVSRG